MFIKVELIKSVLTSVAFLVAGIFGGAKERTTSKKFVYVLHWSVAGIKAVYYMNKKVNSLDDLETGIKHLLLENRCSFSDEEIVLLNECLVVIQKAKSKQNVGLVVKVFEILSRLFIASDHFKDIF